MKRKRSRVVLLRCESYEPQRVYEKIKEGIELLGGMETFIKKGERVLLKPNLLAPDPPETATTTHPSVFEATANLLLQHGVHPCYGDSPALLQKPTTASKRSGIFDVAEKLNCKLSDFEKSKKVFYKNGKQNRVFEIAKGVLESDALISLPKLKTHGFTLMTGAIKNQFGCIPGLAKSGFHAKLDTVKAFSQMLVDLTLLLKPRLYIMDGIIAMEGNGPRRGTPVHLGVLLISSDPVALDSVASTIVGLNPRDVVPTLLGHASGLGSMDDIEVQGDSIEQVRCKFKLPRFNGYYHIIPPFLRRTIRRLCVPRPVINEHKCIRCYECYTICPTDPKSLSIRDTYPEPNYRTCIRCYCCQETCPAGAIIISTKLF